MEGIELDSLNDDELVELLNMLEGMEDVLDEEVEVNSND